MRILITGATGLLGTDLCRALKSRHELFGWARNPKETPGVSLESVDITDGETVMRRMEQLKPEVVVHTAALSQVDFCEKNPTACMRVNQGGTENVARACEQVQGYLVAISTDYVLDGSIVRPKKEEDPTGPVNVYGHSKLEAERQALSLEKRALVLRVSGLFGQARPNFVSQTVQRLRSGERIRAVSNQVNSPSYTVDIAQGIQRLIELYETDRSLAERGGPLYGILHLANEGGASRYEVACEIAGELGIPKEFVSPATQKEMGFSAPRPANSVLDCGRFTRLTQAPLRPWKEALHALVLNVLSKPVF